MVQTGYASPSLQWTLYAHPGPRNSHGTGDGLLAIRRAVRRVPRQGAEASASWNSSWQRSCVALAVALLIAACGGQEPPTTHFVNVTAASGIAYAPGFLAPLPRFDLDRTYAPGGVAAGDYDGDGDVDVFIVRGDIGPNLLYRNLGNLTFEEVAAAAGLANTKSASENYRHAGPMFADMDGDGDLDLFLGGLEGDPCLIFRNEGAGVFLDVTAGSGLDAMRSEQSVGAAFGDYDLDGDLDLFISHWGTERDYSEPGDTEHLWRNDSDASGIRFTSVSVEAGISPSILTLPDPLISLRFWDHTFTPSFARIDDDLYPDILSVGDYNHTHYFVNNRDGTFRNATDVEVLTDDNGMGSALGDYDHDGDLDWFVSSILMKGSLRRAIGNRLYRNDGGVFTDATDEAGVADGGWGWASCFLDIENDGDLDIYHTNGYPFVDRYANEFEADKSRVFVSDGSGQFEENAAELGLDDSGEGRGVVCADFDGDGDIDILELTFSGANLWRNDASGGSFLSVRLEGRAPNTEAAGSRIMLSAGGVTQLREISIASNFVSQNPTDQIFGLGHDTVDELRVQWPDGSETVITDVEANQRLVVRQPDP